MSRGVDNEERSESRLIVCGSGSKVMSLSRFALEIFPDLLPIRPKTTPGSLARPFLRMDSSRDIDPYSATPPFGSMELLKEPTATIA
jgi:hypothetical protein